MGGQAKLYYCSRCSGVAFGRRAELDRHKINHPEAEPDKHYCPFCRWPFPDASALELHGIASGHGLLSFDCNSCQAHFLSDAALQEHLRSCFRSKLVVCNTCGENFADNAAYNKHRKFPAPCSDALKPTRKQTEPSGSDSKTGGTAPLALPSNGNNKGEENDKTGATNPSLVPAKKKKKKKNKKNKNKYLALPVNTNNELKTLFSYEDEPEMPYTQASSSEGPTQCLVCREYFPSLAQYTRHLLFCSSLNSSQYDTHVAENGPGPVRPKKTPVGPKTRQKNQQATKASLPSMLDALHFAPAVQSPGTGPGARGNIVDKQLDDIKTLLRTGHNLDQKNTDVSEHPVGSPHAKQSLLDTPAEPKGRRVPSSASRASPATTSKPVMAPNTSVAAQNTAANLPVASTMAAKNVPPAVGSAPPQAGQVYTGPTDFDQANSICTHIIRLRLQADITIQHGGKVTCNGLEWTRVSVVKQAEVAGMLEGRVHLPAKLQLTEYMPMSKTFKDDAWCFYPTRDFLHTPDPGPKSLGLAAVAIACSKIIVGDGRSEAIKIAAVDVLSCRVLMAYLVHNDLEDDVMNWQSAVTGLSGVEDIEAARRAGYKILKGWQAARTALYSFIDKRSIIVGHNLRADLDALRMIHGRGIDIIKIVEKAAGGPLFKGQLSLDTICREYPKIQLPSPTKFGRDCVQDALAIRQFSLWALKYGDELQKKAKQQMKEYQRLNPTHA